MFTLSCESTVDLPWSYIQSRKISVIEYSYLVNDQEYPDDMGRNPDSMPQFYRFLEDGVIPKTSQITEMAYEAYLEGLLQKGDVLHLGFGTGMTPSILNGIAAGEKLQAKYPDRRIIVIDTTCSSSGYGMLVDDVADLRDAGKDLDEIVEWIKCHSRRLHHQFFSTTLSYYRRSGRLSGPAAAIGTLLSICPIMRLDYDGKIVAYNKVRIKKNAILRTADEMEQHADRGKEYSGKCWICHSNCLSVAEQMKAVLQERFPKIHGDIRICDIGTIIASHCGPGTVAIFFYGDERPQMNDSSKNEGEHE